MKLNNMELRIFNLLSARESVTKHDIVAVLWPRDAPIVPDKTALVHLTRLRKALRGTGHAVRSVRVDNYPTVYSLVEEQTDATARTTRNDRTHVPRA